MDSSGRPVDENFGPRGGFRTDPVASVYNCVLIGSSHSRKPPGPFFKTDVLFVSYITLFSPSGEILF